MDKRTIIFVLSLSAVFFGMQFIFTQYNAHHQGEIQTQKRVVEAIKEEARQQELLSRTAPIEKLPLFVVSDDLFVTEDDGLYIALARNDGFAWPNTIAPSSDSSQHANLLTSFEQFALYRKSGASSGIHSSYPVPVQGRYDIQLVQFDTMHLNVTLAELIDGEVHFPKNHVTTLAIALIQQGSSYRSLGYFDPSTNTVQPLSAVPGFKSFVTASTPKEQEMAKKLAYYVLQNEYQQLVFSNKGASIVEINLPFQDKEDEKSVVLPIEIDRALVQQSPQNALFPLVDATDWQGSKVVQREGGLYPLLRRELVNTTSEPLSHLTPRESAFNVVSEYPEVAELLYTVKSFTDKEIVFEARQPHRRITKTYSLPQDPNTSPYCFTVKVQIEGDSRGLSLSSGILDVEWISGGPAPQIKYLLRRHDKQDVEQVDLPKEVFQTTSVTPDWISNANGFFGIIIDPSCGIDSGFRVEKISGIQAPSRLTLIDKSLDRYKAADLPAYEVLLPIKQNSKTVEVRVFAGPYEDDILKTVDEFYAKEHNGRNADYIACQAFHGWFSFISEPFARFLFFIMKFFHKLFGSWALCIVLVTIVLRILLYPLNSWSMKSMKSMQIVAPKVRAIQEKYKKEPQKAQMEILALYRDYKVNPLSGCLPMLLQMPFLIGMFDLLKSTFELRGASFIPGWINDLASPDVLFTWPYSIPFIGNEFHLLPIILGGIMYLQQITSSQLPKDPAQWTDQQKQQKSMGNIMTIVMTVLFYQFPSGLNIYWISSMLLSVGQQWWTNKMMDKGNSDTNTVVVQPIAKPHKRR